MNLKKRLLGETPKFFRRVINISLSLSAAATALLTTEALVDNFHLPSILIKFAQWCIVAGVVAAAVSKTTVQNNNP